MAGQNLTFEPIPDNPQFKNLVGRTFGRLIVIGYAGVFPVGKGKFKSCWWCECQCGKKVRVRANALLTGNSTSCGCTKGGQFEHGHARRGRQIPEWNIWCLMRRRCHNPKDGSFSIYGGRGIYVCERWRSGFAHFLADMGYRPNPRHTLDRIDNDRGYTCGKCSSCTRKGDGPNCRWATRTEQNRNKRNNRRIEFQGRSMTLGEWAEELGIPASTLSSRLYSKRNKVRAEGWPTERILTEPSSRPSRREPKRDQPSKTRSRTDKPRPGRFSEADIRLMPLPTHHRFRDLTGQMFGRLTVLGFAGSFRSGQGGKKVRCRWWCRCNCGGITQAGTDNLASGAVRSCRCSWLEIGRRRTKHGHNRKGACTPEYRAWSHMIGRCRCPNDKAYAHYGGRGIAVCAGWLKSFPAFLADVGGRPGPRHSLHRIDNDLGYDCGHCEDCQQRGAKPNCRWATKSEQMRNTRRNRRITFRGQSLTLADWSEHLNIPYDVLEYRINGRGWSVEKAFTTPALQSPGIQQALEGRRL